MKRDSYKNIKITKEHMFIVFCIAVFFIALVINNISMYPFSYVIEGDDTGYHYLRTEAIAHKIKNGTFFSDSIDYLFFNGAGYASSVAYPDTLLIIPAVLRVFGLGIGTSMSVFMMLCFAATYLTMFVCVYKIAGNLECATIASVIYVLANYRQDVIYVRFALGEIMAFIFWPVIIYGLYDLLSEGFKKPYIISLGYIGMMMSHTISTVIAAGIGLILIIIYHKNIMRSSEIIKKFLLTVLISLVLTSFYWLPLLDLISSCDLAYKHPWTYVEENTVGFFNLFRDVKRFGMGPVIFLLQIPRLFFIKDSKLRNDKEFENRDIVKILKLADVFLGISVVLCLFAAGMASWPVIKNVFNFMQFPWRMYGPVSMLMAFSAAVYIWLTVNSINIKRKGVIFAVLLVVFNAFSHLDKTGYDSAYYPEDYYEDSDNTFSGGAGEWLPWEARCNYWDYNEEFKMQTENVYTDSQKTLAFTRSDGTLTFDIPEEGCDYADVPFIWYKGYKAYASSGQSLNVSMSDKGFVRVDTSDSAGSVIVKYEDSVLSVVSRIISVFSVFVLIVFVIIKNKKKKSGI